MRISDWSSDVCSSDLDVSAVQGIDGWGSCPNSLGNLILSEAEDAESRFPILNISREMTTDGGGAGQWRGAPGSLNVKQVLKPTSAMAWMVSADHPLRGRSEEHTSELQSLMRRSYDVFCLKKKISQNTNKDEETQK